jgi:hypothetical protein
MIARTPTVISDLLLKVKPSLLYLNKRGDADPAPPFVFLFTVF